MMMMRSFSSSSDTKHAGRIYKPGTIVELEKEEELQKFIQAKDKHLVVSFYVE